MWKYVDDITILEVQEYSHPSNIQAAVDSLSTQSLSNDFQLIESKCKQIRVCFAKKNSNSCLYCLRQLKRLRVALKELILFYCLCVQTHLEYACPVFTVHYQLTWTTIWNVYKDVLFRLFTLPCLMLKHSACLITYTI